MNEVLPEFTLLRPDSIEDVVEALKTTPSAQLCAGGTDLIVNMRHGLVDTDTLVDLSGVPEIGQIKQTDAGLVIGAGVTLRMLCESDLISGAYTAVRQAATMVAGPSHREAATLGGNLCLDTRCLYFNQSQWWRQSNEYCLKYKGDTCHVAPAGNRCRAAFSGDMAPALMVLGAEIMLAGPDGNRSILLEEC